MADVRKLIETIADVSWDSDWHLAEIVAKRARLKHWTVYNWLRGKSSPPPQPSSQKELRQCAPPKF